MDITVRMNLNDKQIKRAVDKEMKPTLMGAGRYVMNIVRASIHQRRDPNKSAIPMHQPFAHAHAGKKPNPGFKKTIVYAMEESGKAVLVGSQLVRPGMSVIAKSHALGDQGGVGKQDRSRSTQRRRHRSGPQKICRTARYCLPHRPRSRSEDRTARLLDSASHQVAGRPLQARVQAYA